MANPGTLRYKAESVTLTRGALGKQTELESFKKVRLGDEEEKLGVDFGLEGLDMICLAQLREWHRVLRKTNAVNVGYHRLYNFKSGQGMHKTATSRSNRGGGSLRRDVLAES